MYNLSDVIGHNRIIKNLSEAVRENRVNHAYIFDGAEGVGKLTVANAFAKLLNCESGQSNACDMCLSCKTFNEGNNPDVIYTTHEKKTYAINEIRTQVIDNLKFAPYSYRYKIYIIDEADKMNTATQNALLKSLEEPPQYAIFILLCENSNMLLPTIHSRCALIRFMPLDSLSVEQYLIDNGLASQRDARLYSGYAMGSIGRAIRLCNSESFNEIREAADNFVADIERADLIQLYRILTTLKKYKDNIDELLEMIYLIYRDALVYKTTGDKRLMIENNDMDKIEQVIRTSSRARLIRRCDAVQDARERLKANGDLELTLESMLFKVKEK
jgi:DNA polymerase-3 subunit delta'